MTEAVNFWGMHFADWVSLAPAAIAIYAVYSAWRAQPAWLILRRRHAAFKPLGVTRRSSKRRVRQIIHGGPNAPADELNWLSTDFPANASGAPRGTGKPMPISFAAPAAELISLSQAYSAYAADLQRGSFLGTTSVPVIERETDMALMTSRLLAEAAAGGGYGVERKSRHVRINSPAIGRELDWWQLPDTKTGTLAYDTFVSYRRHRLRPVYEIPQNAAPTPPAPLELAGLEIEDLAASEAEKRFLREKFETQHSFDGVLPRLVGWRTERDSGNGRLRLHLAMAETTYGAVLLDHYPQTLAAADGTRPGATSDSVDREVQGMQAQLLTLSAIVVTTDRMMLFAGRSKLAGSHPEQFGPAVNGNLELRRRKGIQGDSDEFGLPDPRRALARESSEELGLQLDPDRIHPLGIGRFSVEDKERGTHVFLALAQPSLTAEEIVAGVRNADPMEGRWELGGEFLAAPLPTDQERVNAVLSWLLHDPTLTPHAVLAGIATVARFFHVTPELLQQAAASRQDTSYVPLKIRLNH